MRRLALVLALILSVAACRPKPPTPGGGGTDTTVTPPGDTTPVDTTKVDSTEPPVVDTVKLDTTKVDTIPPTDGTQLPPADTTVVPAPDTQPASTLSAPAPSGKKGIGFGPYDPPSGGPFTGGFVGTSRGSIISDLAAARAAKRGIFVTMTGGSHLQYKTNGKFDLAKWKARMDGYNTPAIKNAVAAAVGDGTLRGNSVMDEPFNKGGPGNETNGWGGVLTKQLVDGLCGYVKSIFPTLPVGVVHDDDDFEPGKAYKVCDFFLSQYRASKGTITHFRDAGLALAKRDHHQVAFSLNIVDGGDPVAGCPKPRTGGPGNQQHCRMTPTQVRVWGWTLGSATCGSAVMWRSKAGLTDNATYLAAMGQVADSLAKLPRKSCRR